MNEHPMSIEIRRLEAEIERLNVEWHAEIERSKRYAEGYEKVIAVRDAEIEQFKGLLVRAADALEHVSWVSQEYCGLASQCHDLITELREAAAELPRL